MRRGGGEAFCSNQVRAKSCPDYQRDRLVNRSAIRDETSLSRLVSMTVGEELNGAVSAPRFLNQGAGLTTGKDLSRRTPRPRGERSEVE